MFSVADTGIGITPQDQERIFQEFTQLENTRQKYVKGTGLGLPLVKKLAEFLGGHLNLQSRSGSARRFRWSCRACIRARRRWRLCRR